MSYRHFNRNRAGEKASAFSGHFSMASHREKQQPTLVAAAIGCNSYRTLTTGRRHLNWNCVRFSGSLQWGRSCAFLVPTWPCRSRIIYRFIIQISRARTCRSELPTSPRWQHRHSCGCCCSAGFFSSFPSLFSLSLWVSRFLVLFKWQRHSPSLDAVSNSHSWSPSRYRQTETHTLVVDIVTRISAKVERERKRERGLSFFNVLFPLRHLRSSRCRFRERSVSGHWVSPPSLDCFGGRDHRPLLSRDVRPDSNNRAPSSRFPPAP